MESRELNSTPDIRPKKRRLVFKKGHYVLQLDPKKRRLVFKRRRFVLQWSLRTMLLVTTVVAAWLPYFRYQRQLPKIEQKVDSLRKMAGELFVEDPSQIAVVHLPERWYEDHRWDIHLPEGDYRMRLATREVDEVEFPPAIKEEPLSAGKHRIELLQSEIGDCWTKIMVDDRPLIEAVEIPAWPHDRKLSDGGLIGNCTQFPPDQPVILFRRRHTRTIGGDSSTTPQLVVEEVVLWIERIAEDESESSEQR